jgi:methyl-accepting chemotaxis protein
MEKQLSPDQRERFFSAQQAQADTIMKYTIIVYFVIGALLGFVYDSLSLAVLSGSIIMVVYFGFRLVWQKSDYYRYMGALALVLFAAQFIYQAPQITEMHFFVLAGVVVLIPYQNWRLQLVFGIALVIHHLTFFILQWNGSATTGENGELKIFSFHLTLEVFVTALCSIWAYRQTKHLETVALTALQVEGQLSNVKNNIAFANEISRGNLGVEYNLLDESDELGKSLLAMRKNLKEASEREQEEKFITVGVTKVGDIIRQNSDNVKKLADEFIIGTVKYMGINQGGLFLLEEENGDPYLELVACYAYERKKFLTRRVRVGEGLLGQCFLEKEQVYMTKVPDDYTHITSGLGGATPSSVLLMPLLTNETIVGVMELASFKPFTPAQIEFIKTAAENIAASIVSSRTTERVKRLLQESQQQTEEMKAQEEEMRQNMEELQATQEEMSRKNADVEKLLAEASSKEQKLQHQLDEISMIKKEEQRKSQEQLEYIENYKKTLLGILDHLPHKIFLKDKDGKMVMVNTAVAKAHHMSVNELIGKSDFDFVDAATAQEWRNQELAIVAKGSESYIHQDSIGGEIRTLKTVKSAFFIPHLNQTGLLGVQTDITGQGGLN